MATQTKHKMRRARKRSGRASGSYSRARKRHRFRRSSNPRAQAFGLGAATTLPQNMVAMQRHFPGFRLIHGRRGVFWRGELRPNPDGPTYRVRIEWHAPKPPRVFVESPMLRRDAPHRYRQGFLCLYFPIDRSWTPEHLIAESIAPWSAQWLDFYEIWLVTKQWFGPEAPHGRRAKREVGNRR